MMSRDIAGKQIKKGHIRVAAGFIQLKTHRQRGVTLIELMIAVAVVGILAAIAYPSYQEHVLKSRRTVAKSALMDLASRQEQYYLDNKSYSADLSRLGFNSSDNPVYLDAQGNRVTASSSDRVYQISVSAWTTTSYTLTAVPQLHQEKDTKCGELKLTSRGIKSANGTQPNTCW